MVDKSNSYSSETKYCDSLYLVIECVRDTIYPSGLNKGNLDVSILSFANDSPKRPDDSHS